MRGFLGASFRSFIGRLTGALSALFASYSITSSLTIGESGLFFLSLGFAIFFSHILKFGLDTFVLKKCSILASESRHGDFLSMVLACAFISIVGSLLFYATTHVAEWLGVYEYTRYVILIFPAAIAMALMGIIAHSLHSMSFVFTGTITSTSINYVLLSLFVWTLSPADAVEAIMYFSAGCFIALAVQFVVAALLFHRKGFTFSKLREARLLRFDHHEIFRTTVPLWIVVISQQLNQWGAQFISSVYVEEGDLALLAIAMRIALIVSMILTSVNMVVSPKFASLYHAGEIDKIEAVLLRSLKLLTVVSVLVFTFIIFFGGDLLRVFGPQYVEARVMLSILVCGQLVNALTGPSGRLLMMSGFEKDIRNSSLVVTVLGLCLAFVLVRWYGVVGAAVATAVTISAQNIFLAYLVKSRVNISLLKVYANIFR